ncbi:hypothetical protein KUTeg_013386 [Tegillarca granosa]|uniref:Uncharacterized protein n=1 Tax=Tegillarca granosa TaxID=220873 RepID=A0ABQ9ETK3_TEGGR|nr:hypothetical protein KUTeg_013386 [Tegillarca granosa]
MAKFKIASIFVVKTYQNKNLCRIIYLKSLKIFLKSKHIYYANYNNVLFKKNNNNNNKNLKKN